MDALQVAAAAPAGHAPPLAFVSPAADGPWGTTAAPSAAAALEAGKVGHTQLYTTVHNVML